MIIYKVTNKKNGKKIRDSVNRRIQEKNDKEI